MQIKIGSWVVVAGFPGEYRVIRFTDAGAVVIRFCAGDMILARDRCSLAPESDPLDYRD
jgi:hypothetical protein